MVTRRVEDALDRMLDGGVLPFRPNFVRRFYKDGGRLGLTRRPGGTYLPRVHLWRPERWIASTVSATNPHPVPDEGHSRIDVRGIQITFRQALRLRGQRILGAERWRIYGADFPVLIKILDAAEPIIFHLHARDTDVRRRPRRFPGERFGKDEAYYFLRAPTGAVPYTHVGLHPGVTRRDLIAAIEAGDGRVLELSPVFHQRVGEGFFTPAGVPHRPGTALTLEIQQPSDVYTLLEPVSGGRRLSARQMHPGFGSLAGALDLIDLNVATDPKLLVRNRLVPVPVDETRDPGGEEAWIFPARLRKFSGKRLVVRTRFESREDGPYVLFVWRGDGRLLGRRLSAGTELLITSEAARRPHLYQAEHHTLEVFKFFPPDLSYWRREVGTAGRIPP